MCGMKSLIHSQTSNIPLHLPQFMGCGCIVTVVVHDDVIKWKRFPRYWPFVRGIHRSPVNSTHKGQWRGALMLPLICVWTNAWVNNRDAGDLIRYLVHYDVTVMCGGAMMMVAVMSIVVVMVVITLFMGNQWMWYQNWKYTVVWVFTETLRCNRLATIYQGH